MLRFFKLATALSKSYRPVAFTTHQNIPQSKYVLGNRINLNGSLRFYSKKSDEVCDKKADCKPRKKDECKKKEDCNKKKLPHLQECARPNLMSECPQPACPHNDPCRGRSNKKIIMLALLALTATLGALFYFMSKKSKEKGAASIASKRMKAAQSEKFPAKSSEIPKSVPYLLIGGGTAAFAAFRAIKSNDPTAKVLVISNEEFFPYMRPPLSKEMWATEDPEDLKELMFKQWNGSKRSLYYEPCDFYIGVKDLLVNENGGVAVARGWNVTNIDVVNRKAYLDDGYEIQYEKCLIATGSMPKNLEVFENASDLVLDRTALFRTIFDFRCTAEKVKNANSVAVIGGGFLGSELACAIARKAKTDQRENFKVYQIFKEAGHMHGVLPEYLSFWTTEKVKHEGVEVMPSTEVVAVSADDEKVSMVLSNGKSLNAELVIVAVGAVPNTEMAVKSDLEIDPDLGGFLVNTELQARSHLFVAGDAACFYDTKLGRRRIEHHDNAVISGRLAGENMTGAAKPYLHQAMFWSDLGPDVGYEAIGLVNSTLPTVGVFAKDKPTEVKPEITEPEVPEHCMKYLNKEDEEKAKDAKQKNIDAAKAAEERRKAAAARPGEDFSKGVIFYLQDDIIVGIVLWNVFNRINIARQVLLDRRKYEDLNEVAKLFNIHEE